MLVTLERLSGLLSSALVVSAIVAMQAAPAQAQTLPTKVACVGEQSTHSAHRENDPEYPELMGRKLDTDFRVDSTKSNPASGGFLYGAGTNFSIGNFGVPKGCVLDNMTSSAEPVIRHSQLTLAGTFKADVLVLGPLGHHEALADRSMTNFSADLRKLIAKVQTFSPAPAILLAQPIPYDGSASDATVSQVNTDTKAVAAELKLQLIDVWSVFINKKSQYFDDATHLNVAGRQLLADTIGAALKEWKAGGGSVGTGGAGSGGSGGATAGAGGSATAGSGGSATAGSGGSATAGAVGSASGGAASGGATSGGATSGGATSSTGGTTGVGGSTTATGGSLATGGSPSSGTGGSSGGSPMPGGSDGSSEESGCSVRAASPRASSASAALLGLAFLAFAARRRRH